MSMQNDDQKSNQTIQIAQDDPEVREVLGEVKNLEQEEKVEEKQDLQQAEAFNPAKPPESPMDTQEGKMGGGIGLPEELDERLAKVNEETIQSAYSLVQKSGKQELVEKLVSMHEAINEMVDAVTLEGPNIEKYINSCDEIISGFSNRLSAAGDQEASARQQKIADNGVMILSEMEKLLNSTS